VKIEKQSNLESEIEDGFGGLSAHVRLVDGMGWDGGQQTKRDLVCLLSQPVPEFNLEQPNPINILLLKF
jgi:hypothetical protein